MPGMKTRLKEMVARLTGKAVIQAVQEYVAPVSEVLVGLHSDVEQHRAEIATLHRRTAELHERTTALQQQLGQAESTLARAEAMLTEVRAMHSDATRRIRLHMWLICLGCIAALAAIVLSLVALGS